MPPPLIVDHPVVADRVRLLRDLTSDGATFRQALGEIAAFLAYEALRDLATMTVTIDTPVAAGIVVPALAESVVLVPVLRAGLGMVAPVQALLRRCDVAHVGLRRDETTLRPAVYLDRLPADLAGRRIVVCDPMLATGGSLITVIDLVKSRGAIDVVALCIIASAPGLDAVASTHPDVRVVCAAVDPELDERGFIVPGLGDAGDRLFGEPPE